MIKNHFIATFLSFFLLMQSTIYAQPVYVDKPVLNRLELELKLIRKGAKAAFKQAQFKKLTEKEKQNLTQFSKRVAIVIGLLAAVGGGLALAIKQIKSSESQVSQKEEIQNQEGARLQQLAKEKQLIAEQFKRDKEEIEKKAAADSKKIEEEIEGIKQQAAANREQAEKAQQQVAMESEAERLQLEQDLAQQEKQNFIDIQQDLEAKKRAIQEQAERDLAEMQRLHEAKNRENLEQLGAGQAPSEILPENDNSLAARLRGVRLKPKLAEQPKVKPTLATEIKAGAKLKHIEPQQHHKKDKTSAQSSLAEKIPIIEGGEVFTNADVEEDEEWKKRYSGTRQPIRRQPVAPSQQEQQEQMAAPPVAPKPLVKLTPEQLKAFEEQRTQAEEDQQRRIQKLRNAHKRDSEIIMQ